MEMPHARWRWFLILPTIFSCLAIACGVLSIFQTRFGTDMPSGFVSIPTETSEPQGIQLLVDVEGQVAHPGLLHITSDPTHPMRIGEVLMQAGGMLTTADTAYVQQNINLASIVMDGTKIYIPKVGESRANSASATQINVNTASLETLQKITGIGATRAQLILDLRPYNSIEDLKNKTKLGTVFDKVKDSITF